MKCKKIKKWLPLFVEGDLDETKSTRVKSHMRDCPLCQKEYHEFKHSLDEAKDWIKNQTLEWEEKEWQNCLNRAWKEKTYKDKIFIPLPFKHFWAVSLILITVIVISVFIINPSMVTRDKTGMSSSALNERDYQKKAELVLVSQETGLKVKWIFNTEFNLKEEIK